MATSIASQLQKLKTFIHTEPEPTKKPFTRPSIIFDPKKAADIDLDALLSLALSGLEALVEVDSRFGNYSNSLFSPSSRDLDRELAGVEENKKIDESISSYLRLLSGHLQLHSSLKTLEYLIRRYKIHVYNTEELILCSLPYHDTHAFVRIVQLLDLGNSKWRFLEGVKVSGAPPPRKVIVQQCMRDVGVLETLCKYAIPVKKYNPSVPVVSFFTAVAVEFLGALPVIDSDTVRRILPFVFSGLEPTTKGGRDHKAGALMIVSLLSNRSSLAHKPVKTLVESISKVARQEAKESTDLPWLRMLLMSMLSLVQSQCIEILPKKVLEILQEIRDFTGVLLGLSKEFNIKKFLSVYLDSLATYSSCEQFYHLALVSAIEIFPVNESINSIVVKVLTNCVKGTDDSEICGTGYRAKKILITIGKKYPSDLQGAVHKFLEDSKVKSKKDKSVIEKLDKILGGTSSVSPDISDSMIWLSLEHPKAEIRRSTLSTLAASGVLKSKTMDPQNLGNIHDAILRRLHDEDLSVVQSALALDGLSNVMDTHTIIEALRSVLFRCLDTVFQNASFGTHKACDVAISCLDYAILNLQDQFDHLEGVATIIFPLLLTSPKTWRLNLKALELAKGIRWPFYCNVYHSYELISTTKEKKLESSLSTSVNMMTVGALAEAFSADPGEYMTWLIECAKSSTLSKTLLLLVILQAFVIKKEEPERVLALFQTCFPFLNKEWKTIESLEVFLDEEVNFSKLDEDCSRFFGKLLDPNSRALHLDLLISVFWRMLHAFIPSASRNALADSEGWVGALDKLFIFFSGSKSKDFFKDHNQLLVMKCNIYPVQFLSRYYTVEGFSAPVQVESLVSFATMCYQTASLEKGISESHLQLLLGFSSILVPLTCEDQDIRVAAMKCIEALQILWRHISISSGKNGNDNVLQHNTRSPFLGDLLDLLVEQKRLILSDRDFLQSLLTALLSISGQNILAPQNIDQRFDTGTKEAIFQYILSSALKLSPYGKLKVLLLLRGKGNAIVHDEGVKSLLSVLLERRHKYHFGVDKSFHALSDIDVETLCFLLESSLSPCASLNGDVPSDHIVEALRVDGFSSVDPAVVQPCLTVLRKLSPSLYSNLKTEMQDQLFETLIYLFRNDNAAIQSTARDTIQRVNVTFATVIRLLNLITAQERGQVSLASGRKKKKSTTEQGVSLHCNLLYKWESRVSFLGSFLDVLLLKKDIENRISLIAPLFKLLSKIFTDEWIVGLFDKDEKWSEASSGVSQTITGTVCYIQQTVLTILEDISASLQVDTLRKDTVLDSFDVKVLLECARGTEDSTTRNHVFSLLSSIAKIIPDKVFENIIDIFTVVGESAAKQSDSHSQRVFEELISTIVPCWISKENGTESLLQIFIDVLPEVAEHRKLTIIVYLLRTLGERNSLASLLVLLIRSAVTRKNKSDADGSSHTSESFAFVFPNEWEHKFAMEVCAQYSCMIWLPSLVLLLKQVHVSGKSQNRITELLFAMQFVLQKLQDTELIFKLESGEDLDIIQKTLGTLMEQVVSYLQLVHAKINSSSVLIKKELTNCIHSVLKVITMKMLPSSFFEGIILLLESPNGFVRKKALGFLCETVSNHDMLKSKPKGKKYLGQKSSTWHNLDESSTVSFIEMCSKIIQLIDASDDSPDSSVKLAAISSLEVVANSIRINSSVFASCLTSVTKQIGSQNVAVSCSCLRTTGALINVVDTQSALTELPQIMEKILSKVRGDMVLAKSNLKRTDAKSLVLKESLSFSVLVTLEVIIEKLDRFLSPYLGGIMELMVLHPEYVLGLDVKIKLKADTVRRLITKKIDVRYTLSPLLNIYPRAVEFEESSISIVFEMLANLIGTMERPSIASNLGKIFEVCLQALDLRRTQPKSVKNVQVVEKSVIHAMIVLIMKLTETMFKPLFIRSLDWAESEVEGNESMQISLDRLISFYYFVEELAEQQRSLFVPYFKYLLDGCTRYLTDGQDIQSAGLSRKTKKAKTSGTVDTEKEAKKLLSPTQWHLRALIVSSLQKCFLFDTGSPKFLDSSNFQVLLKPIVSQLIAEPPHSIEDLPDVPSVSQVDDLLVNCLGQMAVAAGSDLLWKPLNHEVLMQTRSDRVRPRILGLRIVKHFLEHLKEEYLVLLPETIPFLGELLEDVELPVKSLAQEILKEMEFLSGESLRQYL